MGAKFPFPGAIAAVVSSTDFWRSVAIDLLSEGLPKFVSQSVLYRLLRSTQNFIQQNWFFRLNISTIEFITLQLSRSK